MPGEGGGTCLEDSRDLLKGCKQGEGYATMCVLEVPLWWPGGQRWTDRDGVDTAAPVTRLFQS